MELIHIVLILVVVGVLLWLVTTKIPMDPTIKTIIYIVVLIAVLLWLLHGVGGGSMRL